MAEKSRVLVLLTLDEGAFLEDEISYLANEYETVYLIPSESLPDDQENINSKPSELPINVKVIKDVAHEAFKYEWRLLIKYFPYLVRVYIHSIIYSKKRANYFRYVKSLLHYFLIDVRKFEILRMIVEKYHLQDAVYYDYWLLNSTLSLILLKRKGLIKKVICRAHSFDLYDYRHYEGVVPYKEFKVSNLDQVATVSEHGEKYLKNQVRSCFHNKISTHRLGSKYFSKLPQKSDENIIVSCSRLIDFKQVDRIAKSLNLSSKKIKWVHFGGGPESEKIENIISDLPPHINAELKGDVPNQEIIDFYSNNFISAFITLSKIEGLPVSMMEAISFGIPLIGPRVNGVPEITNENTGILLKNAYTNHDVKEAIESLIERKTTINRAGIVAYFKENFEAEKNYNHFISDVLK